MHAGSLPRGLYARKHACAVATAASLATGRPRVPVAPPALAVAAAAAAAALLWLLAPQRARGGVRPVVADDGGRGHGAHHAQVRVHILRGGRLKHEVAAATLWCGAVYWGCGP